MLKTMDEVASAQAALDKLQAEVRACRRCQVAGLPAVGRPLCSGPASAQAMVVAQAPSRSDEASGQLWSGPAGRQLMDWLSWAGLDEATLRSRHYLTAVARCYPGGQGHLPSPRQVSLCRRLLDAELGLVVPEVLVPVGQVAIDAFGGLHRPLEVLVGAAVWVSGTWVVPLPQPTVADRWLSRAENRRRLARALATLREIFRSLELGQSTN